MKTDYLERILTARVYDVAVETPLELAPALSGRLGNTLLLKREDMQPVFSFKLRGANMNFDRLRFVAERAELGEKREAILAVTIPERPGSFKQFCSLLGYAHWDETRNPAYSLFLA